MATVNTYPVTLRHNRAGTFDQTLLEFYYVQNGKLANPYEVCSVHIFPDNNNGDSSNWLDNEANSERYGLVAEAFYASANAIYWCSAAGVLKDPTDTAYDESNFMPDTFMGDPPWSLYSTSGIYRLGTGRFGVVLEVGELWQWNYAGEDEHITGLVSTSSTGLYWDIWTVVDAPGSTPRTYIHKFELFRDNTFSITEPMLVTTRHNLIQKYVNKNSRVQLQITSDHTVNNRNITEDIKNAFTQSVIGDAGIRIIKVKDDTSTGLPFTEVQPWTNNVRIDSNDTITFLWDTAAMELGTYELQVSSNILDQTIMSDKFNLVVR